MKLLYISSLLLFCILVSCTNKTKKKSIDVIEVSEQEINSKAIDTTIKSEIALQINPKKDTLQKDDSIVKSKIHSPNFIIGDIDGDTKKDSVFIVKKNNDSKYGLEIIFGNGNKKYFGMGQEVLEQQFDDFIWIGLFEKVPKGEVIWSNTDEEGDIIMPEDVREEDKMVLPNDGIFIHEAESCGGGIIYLKNGKYHWIQQE